MAVIALQQSLGMALLPCQCRQLSILPLGLPLQSHGQLPLRALGHVDSVDDISEETLQIIFDMQPELVLIGCGDTQVFLPPAIQALFFRRNIGFEVMITDAACRTFNVLVSEGRKVVAALLPR